MGTSQHNNGGSVEPSPAGESALTLTGHQVRQLVEFLGGDLDAEISIGVFDACTDSATGEKMPPGLYVWVTEYPEEGRVGPLERDPSSAVKR